MICRSVPLDEEQFLFIEGLRKDFIRVGDQETATKLLAIALAWKVSPIVRFGCDVDESAGLRAVPPPPANLGIPETGGNVVELLGHSRKAPCA